MNIPPLPPSFVSSIAGSDRAASQQLANAAQTDPAPVTAKGSETVDSIEKGHGSEDSGADGRQLLDTFERREEEDNKESDDKSNHESHPSLSRSDPIHDSETGHIDFTA